MQHARVPCSPLSPAKGSTKLLSAVSVISQAEGSRKSSKSNFAVVTRAKHLSASMRQLQLVSMTCVQETFCPPRGESCSHIVPSQPRGVCPGRTHRPALNRSLSLKTPLRPALSTSAFDFRPCACQHPRVPTSHTFRHMSRSWANILDMAIFSIQSIRL